MSLLQDMMHGVSRFMRKSERLALTNWYNFSSHTHHTGMLARSVLSGNCSCGSVFTFWQEHLEKELPLGLGGFFWLLGTFCLLTGSSAKEEIGIELVQKDTMFKARADLPWPTIPDKNAFWSQLVAVTAPSDRWSARSTLPCLGSSEGILHLSVTG